MQTPKRLDSLDTLRGFDMFFIMGGGGLIIALNTLFPGAFFGTLAEQMVHKEWNGFACYDMIFPLFLFIAGISFPFSLAKKKAAGATQSSIYLNILRRGAVLILLGCVYNNLLQFDFENMRYASVLGRIGIAWAIAAMIFVCCGLKIRIAIAATVLIGYAALLGLVTAPDVAAGVERLSMEGNMVGYIDRMILPGVLYRGSFDPEGLLSAVPAIVTAMLGMFTGEIVRNSTYTEKKKCVTLAILGVVLIVVGQIWNIITPINKSLWSSSYVCFVGGLSMLLFTLFYLVIDVWGKKSWILFFKVIGLNSITIYMAQKIITFNGAAEFFGGGVVKISPEATQPFLSSLIYVAVCWAFLYFLYKKNVFLKV